MIISTKFMVGATVFATVVSIMIASMLPIFVPITANGVSYEDVADQRMALTNFTGVSMLNQAPFVLKGVYTPYVPGQEVSEDSYTVDGWLYGESVDYREIGKVAEIRLDPAHKSDRVLQQSADDVTYLVERTNWWAENGTYDESNWLAVIGHYMEQSLKAPVKFIGDATGWWGDTYTETVNRESSFWDYSGYRYVFQPSLAVETDVDATKQMTLSIVWYQRLTTEGISGGLVVYNENDRVLLANITMQEIIGDYDPNSGYASLYRMSFQGIPVTMAIRFDQSALDGSVPLESAFSLGQWTCGFYAQSISNLIDPNTQAYEINAGSIIDTYSKILTVSYPDLTAPWNFILWVLCTLPLTLLIAEVMLAVLEAIFPKLL